MKYLLLLLLSISAFAGINIIPDKDATGKIVTTVDPFAAKSAYNFRGIGKDCAVAATSTTTCNFAVPYAHVKFNGITLINTAIGDKTNLKVLDNAVGTFSTVPNYTLNQFGFDWYMYKDLTKEVLAYPADLYETMVISVEYTNAGAAKTIYINYYLHQE